MTRIKKIVVVLLSVLVLCSTIAFNTFAYFTSDSYVGYTNGNIPQFSVVTERANGYYYTGLATNVNGFSGGSLASSGSLSSSSRLFAIGNGYPYDLNLGHYIDGSYQITSTVENSNSLVFSAASANSFSFLLDFSGIPSVLDEKVLKIGCLLFATDEISSQNMPIANNFTTPWDFKIAVSYKVLVNDEWVSRVDSITPADNDSLSWFNGGFNFVELFTGGDDIILEQVRGYINNNMTLGYYGVEIVVPTYNHYYFGTVSNDDLQHLANSRIINLSTEPVYNSGYNSGYLNGYNEGEASGLEEGYNSGYNRGYYAGEEAGYDIGYGNGYDEGYDVGYLNGYDVGTGEVIENFNVFDFIIDGVSGFLGAEIFPGFSFGLLLTTIVGLSLLIMFLKVFAGG